MKAPRPRASVFLLGVELDRGPPLVLRSICCTGENKRPIFYSARKLEELAGVKDFTAHAQDWLTWARRGQHVHPGAVLASEGPTANLLQRVRFVERARSLARALVRGHAHAVRTHLQVPRAAALLIG